MSRRVGFLLPVATGRAGAVLRAIPGLSYDAPWLRYRCDGETHQFHVRKVDTVTPAAKAWDVLWITPECFHDYTVGTRAFRYLARVADDINLMAPYTIKKAFAMYPKWAANNLLPQRATAWDAEGNATAWEPIPGSVPTAPHVYAGDGPEATADVDYDPTGTEITQDQEGDENTIFQIEGNQ